MASFKRMFIGSIAALSFPVVVVFAGEIGSPFTCDDTTFNVPVKNGCRVQKYGYSPDSVGTIIGSLD